MGIGRGTGYRGRAADAAQGPFRRDQLMGDKQRLPDGQDLRSPSKGQGAKRHMGARFSPSAVRSRSMSWGLFSGVTISTRRFLSAYSHSTPPCRRPVRQRGAALSRRGGQRQPQGICRQHFPAIYGKPLPDL